MILNWGSGGIESPRDAGISDGARDLSRDNPWAYPGQKLHKDLV